MERRRLRQIASGAAFLAVCAIAVLVVVSQSGSGSSGKGGDVELEEVGLIQEQLRGVPQHGTVLGDPNADVRVIEYGDLQCPICREFSIRTVPGLVREIVRPGTASYDLRQWVVIGQPPRTESTEAAKAALAASLQGRYWDYVELFFRNQGGEESGYVTDEFLTAIARGAGVPDIKRWRRDRRSPRWDDVLAGTDAEADALDFTGTPSIIVEGPAGRRTLTAPSLEDLREAISEVD